MTVHPSKALRKKAATTRFPSPILHHIVGERTREEKITAIAAHIKGILEILGLDLRSGSIKRTPERVASMYVNEVFAGLDLEAFPDVTLFDAEDCSSSCGRIVITRVSIVSFCEHHLVPMVGSAFIGYRPQGTIVGLSKISRIAKYFAGRPQLQERLTAQICDSLSLILGHDDVAVLVVAQHTCVAARGAKDENAKTTTLHTSGIFKTSNEYRGEFLDIAQKMND